MAKSFRILDSKMPPKVLAAAKAKAAKLIAEMPLQELRQAKRLSQEYLADSLATKQANVSRLERRADMYISTLRSYIKAMGGELDIIARFPEGSVLINQFGEI